MRWTPEFQNWLRRLRAPASAPGAGIRSHGAALPEHRTPAAAQAIDTLARTLYGEARGESVRGREAVAAVVVNRVRHARARGGYWWGTTVEEVCRKPYQFSCWNESDPNRAVIAAADGDDPMFACCLRIARRAIAGSLRDPTEGATHYHAVGADPLWAVGRTPCARIGRHVFFKDVE